VVTYFVSDSTYSVTIFFVWN